MSKGAKKTGGRFRRQAQSAFPERLSKARREKTTILIVGEGRETEPNYFRGLTREDEVAAKFAAKVMKGHGQSPESVVEEATRYKQQAKSRDEAYDEVWCVLDVEGADKRASLDRAVAVAKEKDIDLCLSNPCFEVWLLAHFERKARAYDGSVKVIAQLNKHWRKQYKLDYEKNDEGVYERVSDLTRTAITNAQWVRETHHDVNKPTADCNSSTDVYRLVRRLMGLGEPPES